MPTKTKRISTGIIQVEIPEKNHYGFFVRIQREGKPHRKFFSYSRHGGKHGALKKAQEHLHKQKSVLPESRGNKNIKSVRNTSGKVGVHLTSGHSKRWPTSYSWAYVAGWRDPDGKHRHVSASLWKNTANGLRGNWRALRGTTKSLTGIVSLKSMPPNRKNIPAKHKRTEQIVGRERRERVSQLESSGDACVNSRRRVNSDVGHLSMSMKLNLWAVSLALTIAFASCADLVAQTKPTFGRNCEDALALIDNAAVDVMKQPDEYVIAIARLGNRETSRALNQRRLDDVMDRLTEKTRNRAVGASGQRIKGQGRVELYVRGKLSYVILFPTNRRIDCRKLG